MPKVDARKITMNYEQQGTGEPLILLRHDMLTSTRFAAPMMTKIGSAELLIFEGCAHAPLYENVQEFNEKTLQFLQRQAGVGTA